MNPNGHAVPADDDLIAEWLAQALDALEAGRSIDLAQVCGERPHLLPQVAAALGLRGELPALHAQSQTATVPPELLADRYRLLEPIGRGAAGTVWRAHDERLGRDVAVKLLHQGRLGDGDAQARFRREAVVLAGHEHRHIVRIHDQGDSADGSTFLVTELLRGCSLQTVLEAARQAMPDGPSAGAFADTTWLRRLLPEAVLERSYLRQVVRWLAELGDGLTAAHAAGVCHRDVKPSNAFVRTDGSAVLLDFGIAARNGEAGVTQTHAIVGTPCYMAPEQARGRAEPTPALDVYGLAATLYHLLTLRPPHSGDLQEVLVALRQEDPTPAAWLHRGLPRDLQAILDHGLEREPRRRYPTMAHLVADLRAFLDHRPVAARPLPGWRRMTRRMVRRPAQTLAVFFGIAVMAVATLAVPAWLAVAAHGASKERAERLARLPADVCIEGWPDQRALVPVAERKALLAELGQLLDLDRQDLGIRLLRAAERLDGGDRDGAHADLRAVHETATSDYLRLLAERYATAARTADGPFVVDLTSLPDPSPHSVHDSLVAGFHALRARDCERADELLSRAEHYLPARDLRLLAILGRKQPDPDRVLAEANHLEGVYGRKTARTQHALAAAMLQRRQYEAAIPYCEEALRLRPDRHGPWNNLGLAHLRLGHLQDALRSYERAVVLRPWFDNSLSGLCQTLRRLQRFDDARTAAARIGDGNWREYELGNVAVAQALAAVASGDAGARQTAARTAADHFAAAVAAAAGSRNPKAASATGALRLAESLAGADPRSGVVPLLAELRTDPRNARQIASVADLLAGDDVDEATWAWVRLWMLDLAVDLAPDDREIRDRRDVLFRSLRPGR